MRKTLILGIAMMVAMNCFSQEENEETENKSEIRTFFGNGITTNGGFGAIVTRYNEFNSKEAFLLGVRGGIIVNHNFSLGLGGYGLISNNYRNDITAETVQLGFGYGGLYLEPIIAAESPVHVSVPVLIGMGRASYYEDDYFNNFIFRSRDQNVDSDVFFVFEPGVNLEMNIASFFRLAFSLNYRYIHGLDLMGTDDDFLNGMSGGLTFKFGKF